MLEVTEERVLEALKVVQDPDRGQDIVRLGMVKGIQIKDAHVFFALEVDPGRGPSLEPIRKEAENAVYDLSGVLTATAVLTAHNEDGPQQGAPQGPESVPDTERDGKLLPDVKWVIAVASGKGGVGKSTTAANLALALAAEGLSVGLFDADIYGPSMPRMLGLVDQQPRSPDGHVLLPLEGPMGVKTMSMGFLVEEDAPIVWRGPMVMGALEQMFKDVAWGKLDAMIIDMPPGTGDTQLTISQRVALTGAVIVSTPQDIALADARKGLNMFRKVDVPVLGFVENMSYYVCPNCGDKAYIFSHGGAQEAADKLDVPFLGDVPLDIRIRETSDGGNPIVAAEPDSPHAQAYRAIARKMMDVAEKMEADKPAPSIRME